MEELIQRYNQLKQAYERLLYMVKTYKKFYDQHNKKPYLEEENELVVHRDALIKRFEICYDLTWKFFKQILREKFAIEVASPKKAFQACFQQSILTEQEVSLLLDLVDARNQTTHTYDKEIAEDVAQKVIEVYDQLDRLIERVETSIRA